MCAHFQVLRIESSGIHPTGFFVIKIPKKKSGINCVLNGDTSNVESRPSPPGKNLDYCATVPRPTLGAGKKARNY
jgi:hypothetical protein